MFPNYYARLFQLQFSVPGISRYNSYFTISVFYSFDILFSVPTAFPGSRTHIKPYHAYKATRVKNPNQTIPSYKATRVKNTYQPYHAYKATGVTIPYQFIPCLPGYHHSLSFPTSSYFIFRWGIWQVLANIHWTICWTNRSWQILVGLLAVLALPLLDCMQSKPPHLLNQQVLTTFHWSACGLYLSLAGRRAFFSNTLTRPTGLDSLISIPSYSAQMIWSVFCPTVSWWFYQYSVLHFFHWYFPSPVCC